MNSKHDVEFVIVGNEMLRGDGRDSHLEYLGRRLLGIGVRIDRAHVVGDERGRIAAVVRERLTQSRVLVVSGGLGPTQDDITREAVADGLGVPLEFREDQWRNIQDYFKKFGWRVSESNRRQAFFPEGATPVDNLRGTAPGFMIEKSGCLVAVLPGPPREFRTMLEGAVLPAIGDVFKRPALFSATFHTAGIGESAMVKILDSLMDRYGEFALSSLPHVAGVDLVIRAKPGAPDIERLAGRLAAFEADLRQALGDKVYAKDAVNLEETIGNALVGQGATLAIAESLTGGLLGKRITDVPGSSRYLLADVVAYSNESKTGFLGVTQKSLENHGAVSEAVCREMADGVRKKTGATYGLSTTGIAGPTGGTDEKPVGLCYCGLSWAGGSDIRRRVFPGTREDVRERVVWASLFLLHERLA